MICMCLDGQEETDSQVRIQPQARGPNSSVLDRKSRSPRKESLLFVQFGIRVRESQDFVKPCPAFAMEACIRSPTHDCPEACIARHKNSQSSDSHVSTPIRRRGRSTSGRETSAPSSLPRSRDTAFPANDQLTDQALGFVLLDSIRQPPSRSKWLRSKQIWCLDDEGRGGTLRVASERAMDVLNCLCLVSGRAVLFMLIGAFWRVILPLVFSVTLPPTWLLATITVHHVAGSLYLVVNWVVCVASVPDESDPDALVKSMSLKYGGKEEAFAPGLSPELLVRHASAKTTVSHRKCL